ncbi:copper resistance protein CopC [Salinimonas sp. HHU 13199]|uniref:Copper resistance protein C n=1 Tax=Salinimonas profundi TaxID=2729140 RepID=A0ABR8LEN0_9ALTE|nr:copper resistance CopC family protein [Salinimonas profundi]MBD3584740.1 copper resistance protein CopC [Salinimonas profundi]
MKYKNLFLSASLVLATSIAQPAFAHSQMTLSQSSPSDNAMLMSAPEKLSLTFSESVRLTNVTLASKNGEKIDFGFAPAFDKSARFEWTLPSLSPDTYKVSYVVMSDDGHKMTDSYTFMVH